GSPPIYFLPAELLAEADMPFEDPWLREGKPSPIDECRRLYEETDNPVCLLRAYGICRALVRQPAPEAQDALPDRVLAPLDSLEEFVRDVSYEPHDPDALAMRIAQILGFVTRTGQGVRDSAFVQYRRAARDRRFTRALCDEITRRPHVSIETIVFDV